MTKFLFIAAIAIFIVSCSGNSNDQIDLDTQMSDTIFESPVVENAISPGEFVEYHPNGNIKMKGRYDSNSLRTGLWISYYDNNTKWSESYYVAGQRDGHSLTFYPSGQIRYKGEYKMETKVGKWTFYSEEGEITSEENY